MAKGSSPGLGLGLGVGAVAVNSCSSQDDSVFCKTSRVFQIIGWIFSIFMYMVIIYLIITAFVLPALGKKTPKRLFS